MIREIKVHSAHETINIQNVTRINKAVVNIFRGFSHFPSHLDFLPSYLVSLFRIFVYLSHSKRMNG